MPIIAQGAEAILSREKRDGQVVVVKRRPQKSYRIKEIDASLRRSRQRREEKVILTLTKARVPVPKILGSDEQEMSLSLEFIDGPKVRDVIDKEPIRYAEAIGGLLAAMHKAGIAHGDPTTSNFVVKENPKTAHKTVVVIDFGLSVFTKKIEDFAVDMHLLHQVFTGTHTLVATDAWSAAKHAYVKAWPEGKKVIDWLESRVEKRGRNKRK
jgi:TP53 regulating kinase-like protein